MAREDKVSKPGKADYPSLFFETPEAFRSWLDVNHNTIPGIWLHLYKKGSALKLINYYEALDEALCYGWIDGQLKAFDANSYIQKFTPRRKNSSWSKRNIEHIERLTKEGRMQPSGIIEVERAKADDRWLKAYDPPSGMEVPEDFLRELAKDKKALDFFKTLNKANTYAIAWRLQTAKKPETREKRIISFIQMLSRGEKFH